MKKILVTTDLSVASKSGVRFAIQFAQQTRCKLFFAYVIELLKPISWSDQKYQAYKKEEMDKALQNLGKFIESVPGYEKVRGITCIVQDGSDVDTEVVNLAKQVKADFICIGTRGAGTVRKLIGTNTTDILASSPVPVFVVPKTYRSKLITSVLYSSDLENTAEELKRVKHFAKISGAPISVYHFDFLLPLTETRQKLEERIARFKTPGLKFYFKKLHIEKSLGQHLQSEASKTRPSVIVLFTNQKRGWFERWINPSKSASASFSTNVPLLIYPKKQQE